MTESIMQIKGLTLNISEEKRVHTYSVLTQLLCEVNTGKSASSNQTNQDVLFHDNYGSGVKAFRSREQ